MFLNISRERDRLFGNAPCFEPMAQLITVRLNKSDQQPLGFRLQGGKDFGTPLVVQKVNGGSAAERAGLQAGDALIRVNSTDVYTLRHQEAQDTIRAAVVAVLGDHQ
ncbi:unnamed protein product [Leptidea sinapis]|uniref:PDZ domain-containing protein n=1 Tax=Leptidea sinapis TaxID=189913 RepID=A0A5E4Q685_9NEOP|nr:unnamed protein product [Leptidea sinapis]